MDRGYGLGPHDERSMPAAIRDFRRARQKALLQRIIGGLTGRSVDLLSYDDVARQLRASTSIERGIRQIPLDAIVGSVGRYSDFTRTFLPEKDSDLQRWASVRLASNDIIQLPPIEVYQIGDAYFVLDGNHRVSIARQQGLAYIDAEVIEVRTRVPFSTDDRPDTLILKAEYAAFLEFTQLDRLRPEAALSVSVPGQYAKLENHIEVNRYFIEVGEVRDLTDEEAVVRWYDEAYLPMINAIREQGILRYFPGRTETDFYVWLATHRSELQHEYDWQIQPEAAVAKLVSRLSPRKELHSQSIGRRILETYAALRHRDRHEDHFFERGRLLARYSDRLFADLLVLLPEDLEAWYPLDHALEIARLDGAHLHGLVVMPTGAPITGDRIRLMEEMFDRRCQQAERPGSLTFQSSVQADAIRQRALLSDLVVLERNLPIPGEAADAQPAGLPSLVWQLARPVLFVTAPAAPFERILLAYDDGPRAREALFIAAYMAERWSSALVVVAVGARMRPAKDMLSHPRAYLSMHEVDATYVEERGPVSPAFIRTANDCQPDLFIIGAGTNDHLLARKRRGTAGEVLRTWGGRVLLCP